MQLSELTARSGVPLATVKFYLREGFLPPGESVGARRAAYNTSHLERLKLIRALTSAANLPLARVRLVLNVIDSPDGQIPELLGRTIRAIAGTVDDGGTDHALKPSPRAADAVALLGWNASLDQPGMSHLETALAAAEEAGVAPDPELLVHYGNLMHRAAEAEILHIPADPVHAVQYAVLAATLHEPVLAALRLLALQDAVRVAAANGTLGLDEEGT